MSDSAMNLEHLTKDQIWQHAEWGLAAVGPDGRWLDANPKLCEILEWPLVSLRAMTFQQVTHPLDVNDDVEMTDKLRLGQIDHYTMSKRYITKTGRVIWIKLHVTPVRDPETGEFEFFLSQISPPIELTDDPMHVRHRSASRDEPRSPKLKVLAAINDNWKLLVVLFGALMLVLNFYYEVRQLREAMQAASSSEPEVAGP